MGLVAQDVFARADTTGALGTLDTGQSWSEVNGNCGISGQRFYGPGATGTVPGDVAVVDSGISNAEAAFTLPAGTSPNTSNAGLIFRYTDNSNYLRIVINRTGLNNWLIQKCVAGTFTTLASRSNVAHGTGDNFRVVFDGDQITAYQESRLVGTLGPVTETHNQTATKHGLYAIGSTAWRLDGFVVNNLTADTVTSGLPASDNFDRADTVTALGTLTGGATWHRGAGIGGIASNEWYGAGAYAAPGDISIFDADTGDVAVAVTLDASAADGGAGLVFRWVNKSNHWRLFANNTSSDTDAGKWLLQRRSAGTYTTVAATTSWTVGDVVRVVADGDQITVTLNGAAMYSTTSIVHQTASWHGVMAQLDTGWRLDDFSAESLRTGWRVGAIAF